MIREGLKKSGKFIQIEYFPKSYTMFVWYFTMLKFGSAFIVLHCFLDFVTFSSSETLGFILWA